jgi:hypothetical protein
MIESSEEIWLKRWGYLNKNNTIEKRDVDIT